MQYGKHIKTPCDKDAGTWITWAQVKNHLRLTTDDDQNICSTYLAAAIAWAELYLNRALVPGSVKMYYVNEKADAGTFDFILRYWPDRNETPVITYSNADDTTEIINAGKYITGGPVFCRVKDLPAWEDLELEYTPEIYARRDEVIPAILLKVGEIYTGRENLQTPARSAAENLLNAHKNILHL
jgi:hypothetical protein